MKQERPFYLLFFIGLLPFIMVIGNSMFIPLLPMMQVELGLTTFESGWLLSGFSISAAIVVPFSGVLSDRYGQKNVALLSLSLIMIGCLLSALSGMSSVWMMTGRVIQGIGAGGVTPLAMVFITDLYSGHQRNQALGTVEVFNGIGKVISPIIGGFILLYSWYISFVVFFAISLFAFIGLIIVIQEQPIQSVKSERLSLKYKRLIGLTKQHWRWLLPIFSSGAIGMFLLFGYLFYLSHLLNFAELQRSVWNGVILAIPLIALTGCSYVTGRRLKEKEDSYKRGFLYGNGLMIIGSWSMIHSIGIGSILTGMTLFGCGFGIVLPSANAALATIVSVKQRGTVFALYSMLRYLGVALGPILFGAWIQNIEQMSFTSLFFATMNGLILLFCWSCFPIGKSCHPTESV